MQGKKVGGLGNRNFLEAHLGRMVNQRTSTLESIQKERPKFPPPTKSEEEEEEEKEEEEVEEKKKEEEEKENKPTLVGLSGSMTFIKATKADDLNAYYDSPEVVAEKAKILANLIRGTDEFKPKCTVIYTGAGISTAAGIPDYRSKTGLWTKMEKTGKAQSFSHDLASFTPSYSHYAITALLDSNYCHAIVTTNIDNLHQKANSHKKFVHELHGNIFREFCDKCHKVYERDFNVILGGQKEKHVTGRKCEQEGCNGNELKDTIVNFGEGLKDEEYRNACEADKNVDLAIVLGSSMRVSPACNMPRKAVTQNKGKLVLVNLQKTPFEDHYWLHIYSKIDDVMKVVAQELNLSVKT